MKSKRMEGESSSAASIRQRGNVKPPLITCPDCLCRRVVKLKSMKPWSKGNIFYTCPNHRSDGTGCPFWHWEDSYIKYLNDEEKKNDCGGDMNVLEAIPTGESTEQRVMVEDNSDVLLRSVLASCKEIARLLRCMVVGCMVLVFVVLLILIVQLVK